MHVLLLALNYHPDKLGNAPLMTGLAEGLVERGHRVTVVTALAHHESGRVEAQRLWVRETKAGVEIVRSWLLGPAVAGRVASYLSFTLSALVASAPQRP